MRSEPVGAVASMRNGPAWAAVLLQLPAWSTVLMWKYQLSTASSDGLVALLSPASTEVSGTVSGDSVQEAVGPHAARERVNPPMASRDQSRVLFTVVPPSEVLVPLQSAINSPAGPVEPGGNGAIATGAVCQERRGPPHLGAGGLGNAAVCTAEEMCCFGHHVAAKRGYKDLATCLC